jgi:thiol-disulfide isomerase/thioredoxin
MPGLYEIVLRKILPYNNLIAVIFVLVIFSVAGYYIYTNYIGTKNSITDSIFNFNDKTIGVGDKKKPTSKGTGKGTSKGTSYNAVKKMSKKDETIVIVVFSVVGFLIICGLYFWLSGSTSSSTGSGSSSSSSGSGSGTVSGSSGSVSGSSSGVSAPSGLLSQVLSVFKIKSAKSSSNNVMAFYLLAVAAIMLIYFLYHYLYTPKYTNPVKKDKVVKAGSTITVHFFTADWCPHCRKAKPAIDEFEKEYSNKKVNGRKIIINRVDCTDSEVEEVSKQINQFNVTSFPTVKIKDNKGNVFDFDAKITNENLTEFVNSVAKN